MNDTPRHPQHPQGPQRGGGDPAPHDPAELAALYAAGALTKSEAVIFEQRLVAGDAAYVAAYQAVLPALEGLLRADEVPPPPSIRTALASRVALDAAEHKELWGGHGDHDDDATTGASARAVRHGATRGTDAAVVIARATSGRWRRTGVPGVRFQPLYADRKANRRTILLHMDAGTSLPDHDHAGDEEIIMLSGDLSIAGAVLGAGDYIRIPAGARHGVPRTKDGCVCIVVSAYVPFPLSSWPGFVWTAIRGLFSHPKPPR